METREYGFRDADLILIQPVDDHDMEGIENEVRVIRKLTGENFLLIAVKITDWNTDLSPWAAPAVFGNEPFGSGAESTLREILDLCSEHQKQYIIGGYSLAGLFALWASFQTDRFTGVAAASPSVWFPDFIDYMKRNKCRARAAYLSLGDREDKTRNPVMAAVGGCIQEGYRILMEQGVKSTLEWNRGNHFKEPDVRTAKAFAWVMQQRRTK